MPMTDHIITAEKVLSLRNYSGMGTMECKKAIIKAGGDLKLAVGIIKYDGCLISTNNYQDWLIRMRVKPLPSGGGYKRPSPGDHA